MLDRDDNGPPEDADPPLAERHHGGQEPSRQPVQGPAGDEPIPAQLAEPAPAKSSPVRAYLERVEPVFEAELSDGQPVPDQDTSPAQPPPVPRRRRIVLPVVLFLLTCLTTFVAGACKWWPADYLLAPWLGNDMRVIAVESLESPLRRMLLTNWQDGLIYMVCVLAILFCHEMGHFLATLRYRVAASLPFFLPFPAAPFGTLGAVIGMDGRRANRKEIFDIGIAGPLAGLVVAIPVLWVGVGSLDTSGTAHGMFQVEPPLIARWMLALRQPEGYVAGDMIWQSQLNPYLMAGWFGMIITGLNMMPVSQLDGGHVIYTLFGKNSRWIARAFIMLTLAAMVMNWVNRGVFLMVLMVMFIGIDHPPTSDDTVKLGPFRTVLGYASLAIPFVCFAPQLFLV